MRDVFLMSVSAPPEVAVRDARTARARRRADRGAIAATRERLEIIRGTRGGASLKGVEGDGVT